MSEHEKFDYLRRLYTLRDLVNWLRFHFHSDSKNGRTAKEILRQIKICDKDMKKKKLCSFSISSTLRRAEKIAEPFLWLVLADPLPESIRKSMRGWSDGKF